MIQFHGLPRQDQEPDDAQQNSARACTPHEVIQPAPQWDDYWKLIRAGDFDGAVAEAKRQYQGPAPIELPGYPDFYIRHMARNHIEFWNRGQAQETEKKP